jgi:hypothetical protein
MIWRTASLFRPTAVAVSGFALNVVLFVLTTAIPRPLCGLDGKEVDMHSDWVFNPRTWYPSWTAGNIQVIYDHCGEPVSILVYPDIASGEVVYVEGQTIRGGRIPPRIVCSRGG